MSVEISVSGSCDNAHHVIDPSPDTRFSSKGLGSYLDVTLKQKKKVKGVAIAFFAGDKRKIKFTVASDNKLVQTFASSGNTTAPEEFFFDKPVTTQSLRVSFAGNYKKEVTFDKEALSTLPCGNPSFVDGVAVAGSGGVKANVGIDDGSAGNDWFTVTRLTVITDDSPDVDLNTNNVVTNLNDKTSTVKPDSNEPKKKDSGKTSTSVNACGCEINVNTNNNKNSFEERTGTVVAQANVDNKQERDTYKTTLDINTDNSKQLQQASVDVNNKQVTVKTNKKDNITDSKQQELNADSNNKDKINNNINKQEQATAKVDNKTGVKVTSTDEKTNNNLNKQGVKVDDKVNNNQQDQSKAFQITGTPELKATGTGSQSKVVINNKDKETNS